MPIYEFICNDCQATEEHIMKISDPAPTACQQCGKQTLEKMLSRTNFVLKGNGWYETDFKGKPSPQKKQDETKASPESEAPKKEASKATTAKEKPTEAATK